MEKRIEKGDVGIAASGDEVLVARSLGSTLAVMAVDQDAAAAGMAVLVVPGSFAGNQGVSGGEQLKELFSGMVKAGAKPSSMKIYLAGAAGFLSEPEECSLGRELFRFVKGVILKNGLSVYGEHVGGPVNRSVSLDARSGRVTISMVDEKEVVL